MRPGTLQIVGSDLHPMVLAFYRSVTQLICRATWGVNLTPAFDATRTLNILHTTTDPDLLTRLKEMLGSSARADVAVGYFFIKGFDAIADELDGLEKVRILVGRTDRRVLEEVAIGIQQQQALRDRLDADATVRRSERAQLAQTEVSRIAEGVAVLPQDQASQTAVATLRDLIACGKVEVRAYLRSPLHAKAYLCWYDDHAEPGAAVVGSSNLTLAGFSGNTELNVRVTGDAEMGALREWFDALWDESEDVSDALLTELDRSWALAKTPPYHVYLKALHELYHHEIGIVEASLSPGDVSLANFQLDAVSRALTMIDSYGGCYIGDVVGLGKTFIGAEILRQLRLRNPRDGFPLILCPAGLKPMWEYFTEEFRLGAEIVSHNMVTAPPDAEFDEESGRYVDPALPERGIILEQRYANRGPVLVDEAHNFRNVNQRSKGLASYLESGDHKVVLLSATPQNLGPMDIYRQLRLFLHDTEHGLNIEPLSLEAYFRNAQRWLAHQADLENYKQELQGWQPDSDEESRPSKPDEPSVPRAEINDVLLPLFIRRRRKDIRDLYGDTAEVNGNPVRFPEPVLDNVAYRLDKVYAKSGSLDDLQELLKQHKAARYRATEYIKDAATAKPEYRDLFRAGDRIARLMGVLLLKRLESSIEAFRTTLSSLSASNRRFRQALESGIVPFGSTAGRLISGQHFDVDDLEDALKQEEQRRRLSGDTDAKLVHSATDFDTPTWINDIDADFELLNGILDRVHDIGPEDDDKLRALKEFLARQDVQSGKVLIFSEAETTVEYLYRELNPKGKDDDIARLTGATSRDTERLVKRFSPTQNLTKSERTPGPKIRILLATDIVSEGQNLQDCARVLNYDLHWNPVRLIQRFGRVDRIGSEHSVIHLHNMWPDVDVDKQLTLTDTLTERIQLFHDIIGLDSKLLSDAERLNADAMYRIYQEKSLPEMDDGLDEVAANQRAITLLQRIQADDPDLWDTITNLPDGIRSALQAKDTNRTPSPLTEFQTVHPQLLGSSQPTLMAPALSATPFDEPGKGETLVLLDAGGIKGCFAIGSDLQPRRISPAQFIAAAECEPETPASPVPADTNERVMAAFDVFKSESRQRLGRARRRRDTRARRYVSKQLSIALHEADPKSERYRQIDTLRRIFGGELPDPVESALAEIRNLKLEGDALIARLAALREHHRLNPPDQSGATTVPEPQVIRIVCSDGFV